MNPTELRATLGLAGVFAARLLGLFMVYPVFARYAQHLPGASPFNIGLALGVYGLAQGLLQIPLGLVSDRIGRKTVICMGLVLFGVGSVVAARATSIQGLLLGRTLQGAGAVGSSILAMVADLTRDEVRTRAMAMVGATIGLSFVLAIVLGPAIAAAAGLAGIFWVSVGLAVAGIVITLALVPTPARSITPAWPVSTTFGQVLRHRELLRLDFAIFTLHAVLTGGFLVIPRLLSSALHLTSADQWRIYLPVLAGSVVLMIPAIIIAETQGRMKEVFVAAIAAIAASLLMFATVGASAVATVAALTVFFTSFNVMEAMLPSLITKVAPADAKGAATGVYSSAQFLGIFVGGAGAGGLLAIGGTVAVLAAASALVLLWLGVALTMRRPATRGGPSSG